MNYKPKHCRQSLFEHLEPRRLLSAGQLDPTFGDAGVVRIDGSETLEIQTQASAQQSDGKLLLGGISLYNGGEGNFIDVARLTSAGQPDTTFGNDGQVEIGASNTDYTLKSLQVAPNGDILVGTQITAQNGQSATFQITCLLANGSVDTTFGTGGSFSFSLHAGSINAITTDSNGNIYLAGTDGVAQGSFTITRLTSQGLFDNIFGKYGHAIVSFTNVGHGPKQLIPAVANALAIEPNGSIVVAGGGDGVVLAGEAVRLTSTGSLDTTFATGGRLVVPAVSGGFSAVTTAWRGSIVFAGANDASTSSKASNISVSLVDHNGTLVPSFGDNGTAFTSVPSGKQQSTHVTVAGVAVLPNRQILISGAASGHFVNGVLLTRVNPNGVLDANFGQAGLAVDSVAAATNSVVPNSGQYNVLNAAGLFIQSDGDAIVPFAGSASTTPSSTAELRAIAFSTAGSLDTTFGNNAIAAVSTTAEAGNTFTTIAAESNSDILAVGADANQSFINDYDTSGNAIGLFNSEAQCIARAPDGDLLIGEGHTVTRYHADGTIDSNFGQDGTVTFPPGENYNIVGSIAFLPDGAALVEANYGADFSGSQELEVLSDAGAITASVSASYQYGIANDGTVISSYTITPAGKILVQYIDYTSETANDFYVGTERILQYNEDLTPDTSFSIITANGEFAYGPAGSPVIAPDGDIYVGTGIETSYFLSEVARYASNGTLDTTFHTQIPSDYQLFIQPDGKLLAVNGVDGTIELSRYNTDGSLDTTFGTDGSSTIALYAAPISTTDDRQVLFSLTETNGQPKLIAAGTVTLPSQPSDAATFGGSEAFLARLDL